MSFPALFSLVAGDDAVHSDHQDFIDRIVVFDNYFLELRSRLHWLLAVIPENYSPKCIACVRNNLNKISEKTYAQQHNQNDGAKIIHPRPLDGFGGDGVMTGGGGATGGGGGGGGSPGRKECIIA